MSYPDPFYLDDKGKRKVPAGESEPELIIDRTQRCATWPPASIPRHLMNKSLCWITEQVGMKQ